MKLARRLINNAVLVVAVVLIAYGIDRGSQNRFAKRIEAMEVEGMSGPASEHWQVKPGSIYDGDTLRVVRDGEEKKIRFCGIDAPEKDQRLGVWADAAPEYPWEWRRR